MLAWSGPMTLLDIKQALMEELGGSGKFSFINTRLILRTGVDLNKAQDLQLTPERLTRVRKELQEMGFLKDFPPLK